MIKLPSISISATDLQLAAVRLDAEPARIGLAAHRALRRATEWANDLAVRSLSHVSGLRLRMIKNRVRMEILSDRGQVWVGLNRINPSSYNPVQSGASVHADGMTFENAFVGRRVLPSTIGRHDDFGRSGHGRNRGGRVTGAFVAKSEGKVFRRKGVSRLKIEHVWFDLGESCIPMLERIAAGIEKIFAEEFERELK